MTRRRTMLPIALVALLFLALAPGQAVAQAVAQEEEAAFEPGFGDKGSWDEWDDWGRGPGFGRRGHGRGMRGPGFQGPQGLHMALRSLDLSETQRDEIKTIFEAERGQVGAYHEQMRDLGAELREQIENDPFNEEAVRAKAAALASLRVEMAVLRARQAGQVRELLTPEQLDQLEQVKQKRRAFREERRQRFEQRRGPRSMP